MKKLIDKVAPTKREVENYFQNRNGILLPQHLKRELDEYCQGCGETYQNKRQVKYFGQIFCHQCVEKWTGK